MKPLSIAALVVGLILIVTSFLWPQLFPARRNWTDEKSQQMADASSQAHTLHMKVVMGRKKRNAGKEPEGLAKDEADYDSVKRELARLTAEFESAAETPNFIANVLKWTGLVIAGLGAIGVVAGKQES